MHADEGNQNARIHYSEQPESAENSDNNLNIPQNTLEYDLDEVYDDSNYDNSKN